MKEIGGYIELDNFSGQEYHKNAVALNCARNCLAYLIETKKISKLYIPHYLCSSVKNVAARHNIVCEYYNVSEEFKPFLDVSLEKYEYVYIVNYYGTLTDSDIENYKLTWENIIIDNTQDFFRKPISGIDTIYSCRKWFGVSDGAYLYTDQKIDRPLERDISMERIHYVLGRYEKNASEFYKEFTNNNYSFDYEPIKEMSKLTHNILRALNYSKIQNVRTSNYRRLSEKLQKINSINKKQIYGAFAYPLFLESGGKQLREKLIGKKIYIPTLWPDVLETVSKDSIEYSLVENILPLPCDQRYGIEEMDYISEIVLEGY